MLTSRHPFQDTLHHIRLNVSLHLGPEMRRDQCWLLATTWHCLRLGVGLHWLACGHCCLLNLK